MPMSLSTIKERDMLLFLLLNDKTVVGVNLLILIQSLRQTVVGSVF
jgi:hypothetical protein